MGIFMKVLKQLLCKTVEPFLINKIILERTSFVVNRKQQFLINF